MASHQRAFPDTREARIPLQTLRTRGQRGTNRKDQHSRNAQPDGNVPDQSGQAERSPLRERGWPSRSPSERSRRLKSFKPLRRRVLRAAIKTLVQKGNGTCTKGQFEPACSKE